MNKALTFLLIHPEISRTKYNFVGIIENECLELEYICAMLKSEGHNVFIYDGQVEKRSAASAIRAYDPDAVYVCGRTRQENFMLEYCSAAKKHNPDIITIIGGLHAQLSYMRMQKEYVDYILTSFDIFLINKIVGGEDLEGVDGLCYKDMRGEWISNPLKQFDIKLLPRPDRSYFYEHPNNYRYLELEHAAWVRSAYSCPYRCNFCERNRMNGGVYSYREIDDVVDEIAQIDSDNIYIVDDDFLYNEKRVERFADLIKERGIHKKYICYGRSDFISEHEELMKRLADIGLYYVLVGLEAIGDSYLNSYGKKSDVACNIRSIDICNRLGINIMGMFILDPDFTGKDFRRLYKWIKEHDLKHVATSIFTPEMGLENYSRYKDRLISDNPSHYDYLHLVIRPGKIGVRLFYFHYYVLLIKLFLKAKREGVYDFIDYGDYIRSFISNIFRKRRNDDE